MQRKSIKSSILNYLKLHKIDSYLILLYILFFFLSVGLFFSDSDFFEVSIKATAVIAIFILFRNFYSKDVKTSIILFFGGYVLIYVSLILFGIFYDLSEGCTAELCIPASLVMVFVFPIIGGIQVLVFSILSLSQLPLIKLNETIIKKLKIKSNYNLKHNFVDLFTNLVFSLFILVIVTIYYKRLDEIFLFVFILLTITLLYPITILFLKKEFKKILPTLVPIILVLALLSLIVNMVIPIKFKNPVKYFKEPLIVESVIDYPVDTNGNGKFDALIIEINMTVNLPKEYRVFFLINNVKTNTMFSMGFPFDYPSDTHQIKISGENLAKLQNTVYFEYTLQVLDWPVKEPRYFYNKTLKTNNYNYEKDFEEI